MFRKKAQAKPFSNLKSSERKKLLRTICDRFDLNENELSSETKNKLMPKNLRSAKIQLHSGDHALLYSDGERPVWLGMQDHLIPTLFTLWDCPYLLPYLYTPELTIDRLQNGADLMIPGVFEPLPEYAPRGSVVAIATLQNPSVPVAVGVSEVDCHNITEDMRGKAAVVTNVIGDTLLDGYRGGYKVPKELDHELPKVVDQEQEKSDKERDHDESSKEGLEQGEEVKAVTDKVEMLDVNSTTVRENNTGKESDSAALDSNETEGTKTDFSTQEQDAMFKRALLQTLKKAVDTPLDLPMPGSTFLSQYLLPNLPIQHPGVNIKQTSFKKAAKFFKSMEKDQKLLKFRERNGEIVIQSVAGKENESVKAHEIYKVKKQPSSGGSRNSSSNSKEPTSKLVAKEYFKPHSRAQSLFSQVGVDSTIPQPADILRTVLKNYINQKSLASGKQVKLDETLSNALNVKGSATVGRDVILEKLQANCQISHKIFKPAADGGLEEPKKLSKGRIPTVNIMVERRGGNKVVTIVNNLEPFHLNPVTIGEELRVQCAGSTSVTPVIEGSELKQVLVQGPQAKAVTQLLESKGVRSQWINTVDKTSKNKKR